MVSERGKKKKMSDAAKQEAIMHWFLKGDNQDGASRM
jgi:hypothetical protein